MPTPRGPTTSLSKRGQILGYAILDGRQKMTLREISKKTGILESTCSNIIRTARERASVNGIQDLCVTENLKPLPTALKGSNQALTEEEKGHLVETALKDAEHCRMTFTQLAEADISRQTVSKILAENKIHRRKPTTKPSLNAAQQAARLAFCYEHRNYDWHSVIFTDESYFETGNLRQRRARGVLRRAGEAYRPQNIQRKFAQGATVMFWGAILYGKSGIIYLLLLLLLFITISLSLTIFIIFNRRESSIILQREYEFELAENTRATVLGHVVPFPTPELKVRKVERKGGIDWYIYRERILNPLLYPFTQQAIQDFPDRNIKIMEDNAPAHIHHYHNIPRERLGLRKLVWPANSPDLNPIETIWTELKDKLMDQIGPRMTARDIRHVLEQVSFTFPFILLLLTIYIGVEKLSTRTCEPPYRIYVFTNGSLYCR
uniref:Putative transposase n=1 Tax=Tuber indicum TaxID=55307 RepID=W0C8W7_9PEZI|nr:putative transposase [Tuber indicum]